MTGIAGIAIFFFLIPEPASIGIVIDEYTDIEAIIDVASETKVYEEVIKKSVAKGEDL